MEVHHDIMDGRYSAPRSAAPRPPDLMDARVEGCQITGPCTIDEGAVIKSARASSLSVIGRRTHVEEGATSRIVIWPNGWIGPDASVKGSILGRNCHVGRRHH